jgi:plastocyanin
VRRSLVICAAAVALALAFPAAAGAVPRQIDVDDDFFAPRNPPARNFSPGPSFRWSSVAGAMNDHNVRQDDRLFFSGNPTDPLNFRINASAGSYHYYCTLHGSRQGGMAGRVKVRPIAVPDSQPGEIDVRWANSGTDTGSRFDVRYRVDQRRWKIWKNDTPRFHAAFGHNDHPVNYRPNRHTYKLKVRSERRKVRKHSDWSPRLTL